MTTLTQPQTKRSFSQILRFGLIGVLNTLVDLTVLNMFILFFSLDYGTYSYAFFKSLSFLVAVINSYYWNKYFVFTSSGNREGRFLPFVLVSLVGFFLNVAIATLFYQTSSAIFAADLNIASINLGAIAGTLAVMVWNFLGYKLIVFKN